MSHQKQYNKTVTLLKKLSITATDKGWSSIDCVLMKLYAQSLRLTGDLNGHINILLKLLQHRSEIGPLDGKQYIDELEEDFVQSKISITYIIIF
jgi:hypothetical protein